jgi:hypothetical protein
MDSLAITPLQVIFSDLINRLAFNLTIDDMRKTQSQAFSYL